MFSSRKNTTQLKGIRLASFIFFSLFSIILLLSPKSFNEKLSLKLYSVVFVVNKIVYGNFFHFYENVITNQEKIKNLEQELKELSFVKKQNMLLKNKNTMLEEEIKTINKYVSFSNNYFTNRDYFFTSVYLKSITTLHQVLIINLGKKDGILETSLVLAENGVIGYVYKVYKDYSEVLPITANEAKIPAVTGKTKINGVIQGDGTMLPIFKSYENITNLVEGETIYTSGIGGVFDEYIPIGKLTYKNRAWRVKLFASMLNTRKVIIVNRKK